MPRWLRTRKPTAKTASTNNGEALREDFRPPSQTNLLSSSYKCRFDQLSPQEKMPVQCKGYVLGSCFQQLGHLLPGSSHRVQSSNRHDALRPSSCPGRGLSRIGKTSSLMSSAASGVNCWQICCNGCLFNHAKWPAQFALQYSTALGGASRELPTVPGTWARESVEGPGSSRSDCRSGHQQPGAGTTAPRRQHFLVQVSAHPDGFHHRRFKDVGNAEIPLRQRNPKGDQARGCGCGNQPAHGLRDFLGGHLPKACR